jgi:hypothetical protein
MFNVSDPQPVEFRACDSNTHRSRGPVLSMCHSSLYAHLRNIQVYQTVESVIDSYDGLVDLLQSIEHFLHRLDIYTKVPPSAGMTEMIVKILVELLSILALATKQIRQGKSSEFGVSLSLYMT